MRKTTVARGSFLLRLRVHSDGAWVGQVEHISSGWREKFQTQQQLIERLTVMVTGPALDAGTPDMPRGL